MTRTILLADDNRNIREFCRQELEEEGYHVVVACDGREALELFQAERPDLAVLDLRMRGVGGSQTMEKLRAIDPHVPVIFFTAHLDDYTRDLYSRTAAACVEKSADLAELKSAIARCLRDPSSQLPQPTDSR